jgi:hypothetical protein
MPLGTVKRIQAPGWLALPGACCPIGGGLLKIGHGSTLAALALGVAPYVLCALGLLLAGVGFLFAALRYLWTGKPQQDFIATWSSAVVAVLTLTAPKPPERVPGASKVPRAKDGARRPPPSQARGTL